MSDPNFETINALRDRLNTWRHTLNHYLKQVAIKGPGDITPEVSHGINTARSNIQQLKAQLRDLGDAVADQPGDYGEYISISGDRYPVVKNRNRLTRSVLLSILIGLLLIPAAIWLYLKDSLDSTFVSPSIDTPQHISTATLSAISFQTSATSNTPITTPLPLPSPTLGAITASGFSVQRSDREQPISPGGTIEVREGEVLRIEVLLEYAPVDLTFAWSSERGNIPQPLTRTGSTLYTAPADLGNASTDDTITVEIQSRGIALSKQRIFVRIVK